MGLSWKGFGKWVLHVGPLAPIGFALDAKQYLIDDPQRKAAERQAQYDAALADLDRVIASRKPDLARADRAASLAAGVQRRRMEAPAQQPWNILSAGDGIPGAPLAPTARKTLIGI